jgi:hypothetical protein
MYFALVVGNSTSATTSYGSTLVGEIPIFSLGLVLDVVLLIALVYLFREFKVRKIFRVAILTTISGYFFLALGVLGFAIAYWFLSGLTEVPADFLTGLLTFDGIMTAVVALTYGSRFESFSGKLQAVIALYTSLWFVVSALVCLYGLLRLGPTPSVGLAISASSDSAVNSLASSINGIFVWFVYSIYFLYSEPSRVKAAPRL